jgi:hypothetical protein
MSNLYTGVVYNEKVGLVDQLVYAFDDVKDEILKPFLFPELGVRVSVQAGIGTRSSFRQPDGKIVSYPLWTPEINSCRLMGQRRLPLKDAVEFEMAIVQDSKTSSTIALPQTVQEACKVWGIKPELAKRLADLFPPSYNSISSFVPLLDATELLQTLCKLTSTKPSTPTLTTKNASTT